jgi:hypothetical protein
MRFQSESNVKLRNSNLLIICTPVRYSLHVESIGMTMKYILEFQMSIRKSYSARLLAYLALTLLRFGFETEISTQSQTSP